MRRLLDVARELDNGKTSSRQLVEECLAAIENPAGEGKTTFLDVQPEAALRQADEVDRNRSQGRHAGLLAGIPVSIKDLFDQKGVTTRCASLALQGAAPAASDAAVVRRLREAGLIILGRTNMAEFAYSGLGLNPHYGTPRSPFERNIGRAPGGSSSGAAVSVADGMALAGLGTDTGGSCRIPAAFCGVTGFKPTAKRVPQEGCFPLSKSLDSIGPFAPGVSCCALLHAVLAGTEMQVPEERPVSGIRLGLPRDYVLENLDESVSTALESALQRLSSLGVKIEEFSFPELLRFPEAYKDGGIIALEAYRVHQEMLERYGRLYDPRVGRRILLGAGKSEADYQALLRLRRELVESSYARLSRFDALILPTVPFIPPRLDRLVSDEDYYRINLLAVRNPAVANFLDLCSLSLPCHPAGEAPVGLMLIGAHDRDQELFSVGTAVEKALASARHS